METNFKLIKQHAYDTVRYVRNNDYRKNLSFKDYLATGISAPGYARTMLNMAQNDNTRIMVNLMKKKNPFIEEKVKTLANIRIDIKDLWKKNKIEAETFNEAFKQMYPNSWKKRLAIEPFMLEKTGVFLPTSNLKSLKKLTLRLYKFKK